MKKKYWFYTFIWMGFLAVIGCNNDQKPTAPANLVPQKPSLMQPFRFHKLIEVSPGQDYDILSWGRGSTTIGAFMILHSDSAAAKYTTTTGDLVGDITDVYNSDMDLDGNPEILIQVKVKDTVNYTNIYAFEFTYGKAQKLDFPKLSKSQKQGYRGNDNFYIKDGQLYREFPLYTGSGKNAKPNGQTRQLLYGLRSNSFTVKQLSKDSTKVNTIKPMVVAPAAKVVTAGKATVSDKPKKHSSEKKHTTEKKHKKKKKHHRSDEG